MSKCNRCNIKVKDDSLICPLCKGALSETEHVQPVYPDMFPKQQRMRLAIRIVTFCVVVGVVVLGKYCDSGCRDCDEYYNLRIHDGAPPRLAKLYYAAARTDAARSR